MGHNLSRKAVTAKRIFLSYLNLSKQSETIQAYRGWKVSVTVKISAHSELQNKNEESKRAQTPCRNKISEQKQPPRLQFSITRMLAFLYTLGRLTGIGIHDTKLKFCMSQLLKALKSGLFMVVVVAAHNRGCRYIQFIVNTQISIVCSF